MKILLKCISWRIISTGTTILITYLITKNVKSGLHIGLIDMGASFVLYYVHETLWTRCPQTKTQDPPNGETGTAIAIEEGSVYQSLT